MKSFILSLLLAAVASAQGAVIVTPPTENAWTQEFENVLVETGSSSELVYADDDWGLPLISPPVPWYDVPQPGDAGVPMVVDARFLDSDTGLFRSVYFNGRVRIDVVDTASLVAPPDPEQPETVTIAWKSDGVDVVIRLTPKGNEDPKDFVKRLNEYVSLLKELFPPSQNTAGSGSGTSVSVGNGGGTSP